MAVVCERRLRRFSCCTATASVSLSAGSFLCRCSFEYEVIDITPAEYTAKKRAAEGYISQRSRAD